MGDVLLLRRRVIAAKIETTPGDIESLTDTEAAFNVYDPRIQPTIEMAERPGQGTFSALPSVAGSRGGTVTFACDLVGSGNAGSPVPAWASTFLPACGLYEDSDVFRLDSRAPQASEAKSETLTIGVYEDGRLKRLYGAMGTFRIMLESGRPGRIEFTFTGLWAAPSAAPLLTPSYPTVKPRVFRSSTLTIGSWEPKVQQVTIDLGNEVVLRPDPTNATAYATAVVTNRRARGTINPESSLIATKDTHAEWMSPTEPALQVVLGASSADGNLITLDGPKVQILNVQGADRDGVDVEEIEFQLNRSASAGDDELTITFA